MSPSALRSAVVATLVVAAFARSTSAQPLADGDSARGSGSRAPSAELADAGAPEPSAEASSSTPARTGKAAGRRFTDVIPCGACHTTKAWRSQGASGEKAQFDHSTTGFPLTGAHVHVACVDCHNAAVAIKRACVSCHLSDDIHRGRLLQSCDTCHSPAGWRVTQPLDIHRRTRFPLTGMHVLADCSECHRRASENRWTEAPIDCFACHEKDYRRPDIQPVHVGTATTPPFPRDCSLCHRSIAWVPAAAIGSASSPLGRVASPLRAAPPGHDLRFPIGFGVHRTATCDDCHASPVAPRAVRCIGCHAHDPVRLMQQHRQPIATDGASCLTCHPGGTRR
jgi:hypothetical protein